MILSTWFHGDDSSFNGTYAQMLGDSTSVSHYEIYLRCMDVFVGSACRWAEADSIVLVLNEAGVAGVSPERRRYWESCGAVVRVVSNTHRVASDHWNSWQNQFFMLDVMRSLVEMREPEEAIVILDSDCIITGCLRELDVEVLRERRVMLQIEYPPDAVVNGCTREDLSEISRGRGHLRDYSLCVPYLGGEFVAMTRSAMAETLVELENNFQWAAGLSGTAELYPHEEAQLFSVVDPAFDSSHNGGAYIKRLWTQPWAFRNIVGEDVGLPLWHLPAEKRTGIRKLAKASRSDDSWFWSYDTNDWVRRAGYFVGIPSFGVKKLIGDAVSLLIAKTRRAS